MQFDKTYISFNANKTIQELQYNMFRHIEKLEGFMLEHSFYTYLLGEPIYKPDIINLNESLEKLKKRIDTMHKKSAYLIKESNLHIDRIYQKMECDDLKCDNFFIENHNRLECKIRGLVVEYSAIKSQMFSYLQEVI